jgi:hypothetical protein
MSAEADGQADRHDDLRLTAMRARQRVREKSRVSVHEATINARPTGAMPNGRSRTTVRLIQAAPRMMVARIGVRTSSEY